jgi:hypothetical protein
VVALAVGGRLVATAGRQLSAAIGDLPGGIAALAPKNGAVPIDRLESLGPAVQRAQRSAHAGLAQIARTSSSLLVSSVADARRQALDQVGSLDRTLTTATILLRGLPAFLGQDGPKQYFFATQNPAELRGTGGFIGAYAILTIDGGRFQFSNFGAVGDLPSFPDGTVQAPNADFARNYGQFGGADFVPNINLTPDFPSVAVAIERFYTRATGTSLDGVIAADPFALASLLRVTGPVETAGIKVDAANVVDYTTNRAYSQFSDATARKLILGEVAKAVFDRFTQGVGSPATATHELGQSAADGHLLLYSNDTDLEGGFLRTSAGGALVPSKETGATDVLAMIQNNTAGNKTDFYLRRSLAYSVQLGGSGSASAQLAVSLANGAPISGQPAEVIGPIGPDFQPGEDAAYLSLFCSRGCSLARATRDGGDENPSTSRELGLPLYRSYARIPAGKSTELTYRLQLARAWDGSSTGGVYRLAFLNQLTIHPTRLRIEVTVPAGMRITGISPPMAISGRRAVWTGAAHRELVLEVRFAPPLPQRAWRGFLQFLSKPLIHF